MDHFFIFESQMNIWDLDSLCFNKHNFPEDYFVKQGSIHDSNSCLCWAGSVRPPFGEKK